MLGTVGAGELIVADPCEITPSGSRLWRSVLAVAGAAVGLVFVGLALSLALARPAGATPLSRPGVQSTPSSATRSQAPRRPASVGPKPAGSAHGHPQGQSQGQGQAPRP